MFRTLAALCLFLSVGSFAAQAQTLPPNSSWKNQRGSEMKIGSIDEKGAFIGEYINNATGFDCRGTPGYEVKGSQSGNRVWFVVVWKNADKNCNSVTAWRGRLRGRTMNTTWSLAYVDQSGRLRVLNGQDTFQQTN